MDIQKIKKIRHLLHQHPEISNREHKTSARIAEYMDVLHPDRKVALGKTGLAFIFEGKKPGPTVMFRAELDGLPIQEQTGLSYSSVNPNTAHACGHDGHMAILLALSEKIFANRPEKGRAIILFQSAEEVQQGARDMVALLPKYQLEPDMVFALHNIPGFKKNSIIFRKGNFAAASQGITAKLKGKTSHAAEPDKGINPDNAIAEIIIQLNELRQHTELFKNFILLTIIHIRMGEISFGTTPGEAEIMATLRAFENDDMATLTAISMECIRNTAKKHKLSVDISFDEIFPATVNDEKCLQIVKEAATKHHYPLVEIKTPFKWSEDFGYFTGKYKGVLFGIGAGEKHPALHNPDYDFPDDIFECGTEMLYSIYQNQLTGI